MNQLRSVNQIWNKQCIAWSNSAVVLDVIRRKDSNVFMDLILILTDIKISWMLSFIGVLLDLKPKDSFVWCFNQSWSLAKVYKLSRMLYFTTNLIWSVKVVMLKSRERIDKFIFVKYKIHVPSNINFPQYNIPWHTVKGKCLQS